jgi:signal transduction histidine kinase
MAERRTATILWSGGTAIALVATTLLSLRAPSAEVLYCPLVAFASLYVSAWYGAALGVLSLAALIAFPHADAAGSLPVGVAVAAVWLAASLSERRRRAEAEDFERILSLVRHMSSRLDPGEVPAAIVRTAREATGAKASSLRLLAGDGKTLEVRAAEGLSKAYMAKGPVDVRRSPIDRKVLQGEVVQIRDAATDPRFQYPHEAHEEGIASVLCVPLRRKDALVGVLRVYSGRPRHFGDRNARMLLALADHAVIALRHAELHQATLAFMRKVTHELRAPLAAIGSYLKILLEGIGGTLTEQQTDMIRRADRRTTLLLEAVNDLLSLSRARLERPAEANVAFRLPAILDSVVTLMIPRAKQSGVELTLESDPDMPSIVGSPEEIEELVGNLVSNAVKYTPSGGRVVACARMNGECAILRVSDTGIGIPAEDLPRLFNEFHRCSNARKSGIEGTGLGMTIVRTIADRHGANVRVESEEGKGTNIEVRFPLVRA